MIEHATDMVGYLTTIHNSVGHPTGGTSTVLADASTHASTLAEGGHDQVNTSGLGDWIKKNIIGLLMLGGATVAGTHAIRSNAGKVVTIGSLLVFVLMIIALAGSAAKQQSMGNFLLGLIGL